jgi:EAL domain-containing protein (putative c-di-GMP-specific phosphodiesterase class I)
MDDNQVKGDETLTGASYDRAERPRGRHHDAMRARNSSALQDLIADALASDAANEGFEVHYQPMVRLEDNATVAVEALARWSHPLVGNICPKLFVTIAESLGLIGIVDDFVLDHACADAAALARVYGWPVDVHVNVSAARLGQADLDFAVARVLDRQLLHPDRLVLEITETASIVDVPSAVESARRIRQRGVRIALDDFGAGFSWLDRLRTLPVDIVKLDASATHLEVDSERAEAVCKTLLVLCEELELPVVAEGIETHWQAEALARLGCCVGQGYLYGPPEPLARLAAPYLRTASPPRARECWKRA